MNKISSIIFKLSIATLLIGLLATSNSNLVKAETPTSSNTSGGQSLEIAPPVIILNANPGEKVETKILLRDISNGSLLVSNQINDFVAGGEDGTPDIILDDNTSSPYSMKEWVEPLAELTLKSKQIREIPLAIDVPVDASPGGYYCVIRFTGTPPELKGTGVSLSASLGALVLLRVNGEAKESMSIEEFSVNYKGKTGSFFEVAPLNFVERIKNSGNIHEQPSGTISITDMFGKKVATLGVNSTANNVLPQSIRKFEQPLDSSIIGNKILFGRYHADLKITYGDTKQVITKSIEFWVIPYTLIAVSILALIVAFIVLRFLIKRYNRYIISKVQGSHAHKEPPNKKPKR